MKTLTLILVACLILVGTAYAQKVEPVDQAVTVSTPSRDGCMVSGYDHYLTSFGGDVPDCDIYGAWFGPLHTLDNGTIQDVIFGLGITHTWIGDLRAFLYYDITCDGSLDAQGEVLCRPGLDGCFADGCCGCSGDLDGFYMFDDMNAMSIEDDCPTSFAPGCYGPDYDSSGMVIFDGLPSGGCFWLWVADGACGDLGTVTGWEVHLLTESAPTVDAALDIKPGSCPNPFNVKARGRLPVAVLGTDEFDVMDIDVSTVTLEGVAPIWDRYGDVATPVGADPEPCECNDLEGDGFMDLKLKFMRQDITDALGPYEDGDEIELTLTGELMDDTPFSLTDCIWILDKGKDEMITSGNEAVSNPAARENTQPSTWSTIKALYR